MIRDLDRVHNKINTHIDLNAKYLRKKFIFNNMDHFINLNHLYL